mmetsp:Transcript_17557/g.29586  ORF Transcript_17557/g.29586 Transcript_17557/m.29586 type:complete len:203 (+) Transcript_17557:213-821(+)
MVAAVILHACIASAGSDSRCFPRVSVFHLVHILVDTSLWADAIFERHNYSSSAATTIIHCCCRRRIKSRRHSGRNGTTRLLPLIVVIIIIIIFVFLLTIALLRLFQTMLNIAFAALTGTAAINIAIATATVEVINYIVTHREHLITSGATSSSWGSASISTSATSSTSSSTRSRSRSAIRLCLIMFAAANSKGVISSYICKR